jgi:hypothetical protein
VFLIRVGPEKAEQRVAAVVTARLGDAEISEERNPLRLGEQRVQLSPVSSA